MNKENLKVLKTIFKAYYKERETLCYDIERNRNIFTKGIICLIFPHQECLFLVVPDCYYRMHKYCFVHETLRIIFWKSAYIHVKAVISLLNFLLKTKGSDVMCMILGHWSGWLLFLYLPILDSPSWAHLHSLYLHEWFNTLSCYFCYLCVETVGQDLCSQYFVCMCTYCGLKLCFVNIK